MKEHSKVIEVVGLGKSYNGVEVLRDINLSINGGEILALAGENGAGKSTLIKILTGLEQPTQGSILLNGQDVTIHGASAAHKLGISLVNQEFRLVPQLTVLDNMFLGREKTKNGLLDRQRGRAEAFEHLNRLGLDIDPNTPVDELSVADQQMVEIARALSRSFQLLILDEPTAALHAAETERLLTFLKTLRDDGKSILYVSHHMEELFTIADRAAVLRDGRFVGELSGSEMSEPALVQLMLGREVEKMQADGTGSNALDPETIVLNVQDFTCNRIHLPLNLSLAKGEVMGIAGLSGSGRTELMSALFGENTSQGKVILDGNELKLKNQPSLVGSGLFMLSEDRKTAGIFGQLSLIDNTFVKGDGAKTKPLGLRVIRGKSENSRFEELREVLDIRCQTPSQEIRTLSGGNQQKVLFGRAVESRCKVLLLNEPTRGVDVGAKAEIYKVIGRLADQGVAVIVSSSDVGELVVVSDRCIVMNGGRPVAEFEGSDITEHNIVAASVRDFEQAGEAA